MKTVLIFGITGQLGSFLAEKYLNKNYEVHGVIRRSSSFNTGRITHIFDKLHLHYGDITDSNSVDKVITKIQPDYIIGAAAQSHVAVSFELPLYTGECDALGTLKILESIKNHSPKSKFVQLSTSELFGKVLETPQTEKTPFNPLSPYATAKLYGYYITHNYRNSYNIFASNVICFNMESERRGETFVTKKITTGLSNWEKNHKPIQLGNLEAKRDWGYCYEYADGIIKILEHDQPDDFVLATNETHSIREFIEEACKYINVKLIWTGEGVNEKGIDEITGQTIIEINPKYFRPAEVDLLLGDYTKAKTILGWEPKVKFKELVKIMMKHDLEKNNGKN